MERALLLCLLTEKKLIIIASSQHIIGAMLDAADVDVKVLCRKVTIHSDFINLMNAIRC